MNTPSAATLHYIHDPLCGWCYAAAPLVRAARGVPGLALALHGGGMMAGAYRQPVTPTLRAYVIEHDRRIARLTGQPFGEAYFDGLLRDPGAVFDSAPPITALLAADALAGRAADLLARQQQAHYVEGRRIAEREVELELAADIGLDAQAFAARFDALSGAATDAHIAASRRLLAEVGGRGFPTLVLAHGDRREVLDLSPWLGRPAAFAAMLREHLSGAGTDTASDDSPACTPDGCTPDSEHAPR